MLSAVFFMTLFGFTASLYGYYTLDYWFNAQSNYEGYYDSTFYLNVARFIPFSEMDDGRYRDCQFGFPRGIRGSAIVPTIFYFVFLPHYDQAIIKPFKVSTQHSYVPIYLNWEKLLTKCDDSKAPLCSWQQFISFADPFMIDLNALALMNPYLTAIFQCHINSLGTKWELGCKIRYPTNVSKPLYHLHVPLTFGNCYPIKSKAHMSLIYIFAVCYHYEKRINDSPYLKRICPDPCLKEPCKHINFAVACKATGIFKDSFKCKCLDRYDYDPIAQRCIIRNFCVYMHTELSICNEEGTDRCEFSELTGAK